MTDVLQLASRLSSIRNAERNERFRRKREALQRGNSPSSRMRIAIVTETWPPEINGVALTVQSLAQGLAALGHSIEVVRPRQDDDAAAAIEGFDHLPMPGAALPRYPGLRFGLPAHRRLHRRWSSERPDVLYIATEGPLGLTALGAARRLGIPVSSGFHTRFDDYARHYGLRLPDADRLCLSAPLP